jgi:LacI family transcriptional regulator/LacI family asc operon transcriptional repressor
MNIYDVSQRAGVSTATVSRVLNGGGSVSLKTRNKVLSVINETGYTPNIFARSLGLNTSNNIGILCADSSDPWLANAVYYTERRLKANNYDSLLCCTGYNYSDKVNYLKMLTQKRVDAVVLVGSNFVENTAELNGYIKSTARNTPVFIINGKMDGNNIYSSLCDDFGGAYAAACELINMGCKSLAYFYQRSSYSGIKKLNGFESAVRETDGVNLNCLQIPNEYRTAAERTQIIREFLTAHPDTDGVLTSNDALAAFSVKSAVSLGLDVPRDLKIIGYNNSDICEYTTPELSSVDNKSEIICNECVDMIIGVLSGKNVPKSITYEAEIIHRKTTG